MRYALLLLPLALFSSCGEVPPTDRAVVDLAPTDLLVRYQGLIGNWIDSTSSDDYVCYERWSMDGDSVISGLGHVIADGDTVFIEDLRIGVTNGQAVYSARVGSQNNGAWIPFAAQETGVDTLMFENAAHDFPQCITYIKHASGGWNVSVTGTEEGEDREELFVFRPR
jgi:Domain of unknown function (DUF6265)